MNTGMGLAKFGESKSERSHSQSLISLSFEESKKKLVD